MTKALKIVGIVFLVAAILFGGTYLTINLLNKKVERYEVFADSKFFTNDLTTSYGGPEGDTVAEKVVNDTKLISDVLRLKYYFLKPYFATVGISYSQKKSLTKLIEENNANYDLLVSYANDYIKNASAKSFYLALLPSYITAMNSQVALTNEMQNVLLENEVILNDNLLLFFEVNNDFIDIALNITLKGLYLEYVDNSSVTEANYINRNSFITGKDYTTGEEVDLIMSISSVNTEIRRCIYYHNYAHIYTKFDTDKIYSDASYKAFKSAIYNYKTGRNSMTDSDLLSHYTRLTADKNYSNKTAQSALNAYQPIIYLCKTATCDAKISPFYSETDTFTNNLALLFN